LRRGARGPWLGCSAFPKCRGRLGWKTLDDDARAELEKKLEAHEKLHPQIEILDTDGNVIPDGTPIEELLVPGGKAELAIHPEYRAADSSEAA
ncbi:MAG: hypothetical protein KC983_02080, partial [Phycisphaerales bacterium]|nr:hypothetical protein [Phycisphaerales bacterium]